MNPSSLVPVNNSDNPNSKELTEKALGTSSVSQEVINIITTKQQSFFSKIIMSKGEKTILAEKEQKDLELVRYELEARNDNFKAMRETETKLFKLALNIVLQRGQVDVNKDLMIYFAQQKNLLIDKLEELTGDFYDILAKKALKADKSPIDEVKESSKREVRKLLEDYEAKKQELYDRFNEITKNGVK